MPSAPFAATLRCSLPALVVAGGAGLLAQTPGEDVFTLGVVEVAADRLPSAPPAGAPATLSRTELRRHDRRDLAAALPLLPGVTLTNVGERNEALAAIRGFDLRQVPLFLDGVPVYVPYDGVVDLRRFSTSDVAELRVAKGFSSVLYGPNALGGAINVVTRRPRTSFAEAGAFTGSGDTFGGEATAASVRGAWYAQLHASHEEQDTFPLSDDFTPRPTEDGGDRNNAFRRDEKLALKLGFAPDERTEHALGLTLQQGEKGNPPYAGTDPRQRARYWQWPQWDKTSLYYTARLPLGDAYLRPRVFYDTFENALFAYDNATYTTQALGSSFRSYYDDYTWGGALEGGLPAWHGHTLKAALHFKRDVHREHNAGQPVQRMTDETAALALEDTWAPTGQLALVAGVSFERRRSLQAQNRSGPGFTAFPGNDNTTTNPQLGLFVTPSESFAWHATVARKTRFPTLKDRYSYRLGSALPNPALAPERAWHFALGGEARLPLGLTLDAEVFAARLSDAIIQVDDVARTPANLPLFQLQNAGRVDHQGVEVTLSGTPHPTLRWAASYAWLDRENQSRPAIRLTDTPEHRLLASLDWQVLPRLALIPLVEYATDRYSTSYGVTAAGCTRVDLRAVLTLRAGVELSGGVHNLFDRDHALREGFPEPGRHVSARLDWRF